MNIEERILTNSDCYRESYDSEKQFAQLHTIGTAQPSADVLASYWGNPGIKACVHYLCDAVIPGKVLHILPDERAAYADAGIGNRKGITVELMETDAIRYIPGTASYEILDRQKAVKHIQTAYNTAVELFTSICKKHGWNPLEKLPEGIYRVASHQECAAKGLASGHVDPTHIWTLINKTMDDFRLDIAENLKLDEYNTIVNTIEKGKTPASFIASLGSEACKADAILEIAKPIAEKYSLFPSVLAAQVILESGYCTESELVPYNNVLGMKAYLVNSAWSGSTWNGIDKVIIRTTEFIDGAEKTIEDYFRIYPSIESCMADMQAFFTTYPKYEGIRDCKNYVDQISLEFERGYATDPGYISKVVGIIRKYNLDRYDVVKPAKTVKYQVQCSVFSVKSNADSFAGQLKEYGFNPVVKKTDGNYVVRLKPTFAVKAKAEKRIQRLKALGLCDPILKEV